MTKYIKLFLGDGVSIGLNPVMHVWGNGTVSIVVVAKVVVVNVVVTIIVVVVKSVVNSVVVKSSSEMGFIVGSITVGSASSMSGSQHPAQCSHRTSGSTV